MKKKNLIKLTVLFTLLSFAFISCNKEMIENQEVESAQLSQFEKDKQIIASMGFNIDDIEVDEKGYRIEGDIIITKEHLLANQFTTKQRKNSTVVNGDNTYYIYVSQTVKENYKKWDDAIKAAINEWNNIPLCKINLQYLDQLANGLPTPDTRVNVGTFSQSSSTYADALYPNYITGKPGSEIRINIYRTGESFEVLKDVAVHEIGHTLGLMHNIETQYELIPGTPLDEGDKSIMRTYPLIWAGFSYYDIVACQTLWPDLDLSGYYSGTYADIRVYGDLQNVTKYEWTVIGSQSVNSTQGHIAYITAYPDSRYLDVILTPTDRAGRKIRITKRFNRQ